MKKKNVSIKKHHQVTNEQILAFGKRIAHGKNNNDVVKACNQENTQAIRSLNDN